MDPLRIVFMGSPDFAVPSLEKLHDSPHEIVVVASNPDKRRGRRSKPTPTAVKQKALDLKLPVLDVEDVKSEEFAGRLAELKPDLFVVVAFRILPEKLLHIPAKGAINLHASLLPRYRGAAPIHWAIIKGEKETGCTVFYLDNKVDTGEIIGRVKTKIGKDETTGDLYNRLKVLGADLLADTVNVIAEGKAERIPQQDEQATPAPKLFSENTRVDFSKSAEEVHNLIRGLNPFPVAWCKYDGKKLNIYESAIGPDLNLKPGTLSLQDGRLLAGCGKGTVELRSIQLPGTKRLTGIEFANGYDLSIPLE